MFTYLYHSSTNFSQGKSIFSTVIHLLLINPHFLGTQEAEVCGSLEFGAGLVYTVVAIKELRRYLGNDGCHGYKGNDGYLCSMLFLLLS